MSSTPDTRSFPQAISIDPDYTTRTGYAPAFLGQGRRRVPLPRLPAMLRAQAAINAQALPDQDPVVLPYHHFSLVVNATRKLAFYTAVNIDGAQHKPLLREPDRWLPDPRIPLHAQTINALYTHNILDRGHLVRRLDPAWGSSAKAALDDTFHFTNCSPHHLEFDQNHATWQGLEDSILDNAIVMAARLSVCTGPVFRADDLCYRGVQLPPQYWKILVMVPPRGTLSASAYLLSQQALLRDGIHTAWADNASVVPFQVTVRQISALTGLSFGRLAKHDPLDQSPHSLVPQLLTGYHALQLYA